MIRHHSQCAARGVPRQLAANRGRGFTMVEIIVVIAIIVALLSILIVALNYATRAAQTADTRFLMNSIKQGLVRFQADVGYYPPVLGVSGTPGVPNDIRNYFMPPDPTSGSFSADAQLWFSESSIADYMIGYGESDADGYGDAAVNEIPFTGIRNPGLDGVWGATIGGNGTFAERNPQIEGQRLGPYIELKDDNLLASTNGQRTGPNGRLVVFFPGEAGYDPDAPKVLCDFWGAPIRYYRKPYPIGGLRHGYRVDVRDPSSRPPSLAEVFLLRPYKVADGQEVDARYADASGDTTASADLVSADFALFSGGPDLSFDATRRVDANDLNKDNIVEVGP